MYDACIQRVQHGHQAADIIYHQFPFWPVSPMSCRPSIHASSVMRIAVLDSSFNPPTLAHLALASSSYPGSETDPEKDYDAVLLLLSVRNADKQLSPGDASYSQRLEMMVTLARQITHLNPAVAITNEPTFIGKSKALHAILTSLLGIRLDRSVGSGGDLSPPRLVFLQGMDTLERMLSPRYYDSEAAMYSALETFFSAQEDDCSIVCARRLISDAPVEGELEKEQRVMQKIQEITTPDRVVIVDIDDGVKSISSSEVRRRIKAGDESWRQMIPKSVADCIDTHNLYCD